MFNRVRLLLVLLVVAAPGGSAVTGGDAKLLEGEWASKTYENNQGLQGADGVWTSPGRRNSKAAKVSTAGCSRG